MAGELQPNELGGQEIDGSRDKVTRRGLLIGAGLGALGLGTLAAYVVVFGDQLREHDRQLEKCAADATVGHAHPTATPNPNEVPPDYYDACGDPQSVYPGPYFGR